MGLSKNWGLICECPQNKSPSIWGVIWELRATIESQCPTSPQDVSIALLHCCWVVLAWLGPSLGVKDGLYWTLLQEHLTETLAISSLSKPRKDIGRPPNMCPDQNLDSWVLNPAYEAASSFHVKGHYNDFWPASPGGFEISS